MVGGVKGGGDKVSGGVAGFIPTVLHNSLSTVYDQTIILSMRWCAGSDENTGTASVGAPDV